MCLLAFRRVDLDIREPSSGKVQGANQCELEKLHGSHLCDFGCVCFESYERDGGSSMPTEMGFASAKRRRTRRADRSSSAFKPVEENPLLSHQAHELSCSPSGLPQITSCTRVHWVGAHKYSSKQLSQIHDHFLPHNAENGP